MNSDASKKPRFPIRVQLNDHIENQYRDSVFDQSVTELVQRTRLPYMLVYNVVHRRVNSISRRNFRILFGEDPPMQPTPKVDGTFFRDMVRLWLYINDHESKSDVYMNLHPGKHFHKPDYRIFSGQVMTVDVALEQKMLHRFQENGLDPATVRLWIQEMDATHHTPRVPYRRIRPHLLFLKERLAVHPNAVLNQLFDRYETGELKTVSAPVFERALALRQKAEKALKADLALEMERLKEEIYGPKTGYTLYFEVAAELKFLQKYAHRSPKQYVGRSISIYDKGICKRLPSATAEVIRRDCAGFIRNHPELPLRVLPHTFRREYLARLLSLLVRRTTDLMFQDNSLELEKKILTPINSRDIYKREEFGFTRFDLASHALGMHKKAFDLMVARHCQIFREVGRYDRYWYLSDLYLKELSEKPDFPLVTAKYERLSKGLQTADPENTCLN